MSTAERTYGYDSRPNWNGASSGPSNGPWGDHSHRPFRMHPGWIAVTILGFVFWWPVGLAILGFIFWSKAMGCHSGERWERKMQRMEDKVTRMRERFGGGFGGGFGPRSSGNNAFDEYRAETLRRLEDEQREFRDFLDRLRFAKDKAEFDQFMAERRNRPPQSDTPSPQPQS